MPLQVLVSFPGNMSLDDFSVRIQTLKEMGCQVHLEGAPIHKAVKTPTKSAAFQVAEALTPNEEALIDKGMEAIFKKKSAPLLDSMGVFKEKLNVSHEIRTYFQENPGHGSNDAAAALANKLEEHFSDINDAFKRIKNVINALCCRNAPQYCLDKRGRGRLAQIYLVA